MSWARFQGTVGLSPDPQIALGELGNAEALSAQMVFGGVQRHLAGADVDRDAHACAELG